jgi:hypothetical protein
MFNDDDAENIINMDQRIPDGFIDGSNYARTIVSLIDALESMDDSYLSSIQWMMTTINECYDEVEENGKYSSVFNVDKACDTVTALSYIIATTFSKLDDEQREQFIDEHRKSVIPELLSNAETIPFYDIENDVEHVLNVLDGLEPFDEIIFIDGDDDEQQNS